MTLQIDYFTPVTTVNTTTTGNQSTPTVALLGSGNYVVVWRDDGAPSSPTFTIKAQIFSNDGTAQGSEFTVSTGSSDQAYAPAVTALRSGGDDFVVSWHTTTNYFPAANGGYELGYTGEDTLWARSYVSGVGGTATQIATNVGGSTETLFSGGGVTTLPNGTVLFSWLSANDVYFAYVSPDLGAIFPSNLIGAGGGEPFEQDPMIVGLPDGRMAIHFAYHRSDGVDDSRLTIMTEPGIFDEYSLSHPVDAITPLAEGGLVMGWRLRGENGSSYSAAIQFLGANGVLGAVIPIDDASAFITGPAIAEVSPGIIAVTWTDRDDKAIHLQLYDESGSTVGAPLLLEGANAGEEYYPDIAALGNGRFAVTWYTTDGSVDGSVRAVRQQVLSLIEDGNHAPVISGFGGDPNGVVAFHENSAASDIVATVAATDSDGDTLTYSFLSGHDEALFQIDASGHIRFLASPDFEAPADTNGDNVYELLVDVADGNGGHDSTLVKIAVQDAVDNPIDDIPVILDRYGNEADPFTEDVAVPETSTYVATIAARDLTPNDVLTFSLVSGVPGDDTDLFTIDAATGELRFKTAKDYEAPSSSNGDNDYYVTVRVTDLAGHYDEKRYDVYITDVGIGHVAVEVGAPTVAEGNIGDAPTVIPVTFKRYYSSDAFDLHFTLGAGQALLGGDYTTNLPASGTVHFDNNEYEHTYYVTVLPDNVAQGNQPLTVTITGTTGGQDYSATVDVATATITIVDDDVAHSGVTRTALPGGSTVYGTANDDVLIGLAGDDILLGGEGEDHLYGGAGSDHLGGGEGADILEGGTGDDFYFVSDAFDTVIERVGGGVDQVTTTINYTLGSQVENLALAASGLTVHGNFLANTIWGSSGTDIIYAEMGSDTVKAAGGDDIVYGGTGHDILYGEDGDDLLYGERNDDTLYGGAGDDQLYGGDGSDHLGGGVGADYLAGGAGNDFYFIDDSFDTIFEAANEGRDLVTSTIGYTLGDNLEDLVLEGTGGLVGTGNALDNLIIGGSGNNILYGMDGNDTLYGRGGGDTLYGGAGADRFKYQSVIDSPNGNADRIKDFSAAEGDVIDFSYMDADSRTSADESFAWLGTGAFTGAGAQLRYNIVGSDSHIEGDVNGDGIADFTIVVEGTTTLVAANFML